MNWLFPSVIATLTSSVFLALIYFYLYYQERARVLKVWAVAWLIYSLRFAFMLLIIQQGKTPALFLANQLCALFFCWPQLHGAYLWMGRKMPKYWLAAFIACELWIITSLLGNFSFMLFSLPTFLFLGIVTVWSGILILRSGKGDGFGALLTGCVLVLWGIHKLDYPFLRPMEWFAPWGYLIGALFALATGVGMLLLYFERTRASLAEKERYLREVFEAADNVAFVTTDLRGRDTTIRDFSPGAERIFGYTRAEAVGQPVAILHEPAAVDGFEDMQRSLAETGEVHFSEIQAVRKGGEPFPIMFTLKPRYDSAGHLVGTVGVSLDITHRKQTEDRLRLRDQEYRTLLACTKDGFGCADINSKIVEVNDTYCSMIGYSREELLNMSIMDVEGAETSEDIRQHIEKIMTMGSDAFESQQRRKDGSVMDVEITATYLPISGGRFYVFVRDVTERKRLEEQLRQAQKMEAVGQLAGGVAHDFNNILQAVLGYSEMALEELGNDGPATEALREMTKAAQRGGILVRQLLAFSRRQVLEIATLNLKQVVADVFGMLERVLGEHIFLEIDTPEQVDCIGADRGQIEQILMNLCINARDAMPGGGRIVIGLRNEMLEEAQCEGSPHMVPGPHVALTVSDTGRGMDEKTREHVFEPFFTTKPQGTGLGLATVYGIVHQHGGMIGVTSTPDFGTTFTIHFPAISETAAANAIRPVEHLSEYHGAETILMAEDNSGIRNVTTRLLERAGYRVIVAQDGEEAMQLFDAHSDEIDFALLDVVMPKLSGTTVAQYIRQKSDHIPILFASGFPSGEALDDFAAISKSKMVQKPFSRAALLSAIRALLDQPA